MSAKQATQEVLATSSKPYNIPAELGEWYSFNRGETVTWQATDAFGPFTLQQGSGPNDIFSFPISSTATQPYVAQAVASKSGSMKCVKQTRSAANRTSGNLQSGNVIIVDTSTPGPTAARGNQN